MPAHSFTDTDIKQLTRGAGATFLSTITEPRRRSTARLVGSNSISTGVEVAPGRQARCLIVPFRLPLPGRPYWRRVAIDAVTARRVFGGGSQASPRGVKFVCTQKMSQSPIPHSVAARLCSWPPFRQVCVRVTNEICKHCLVINATTWATKLCWWSVPFSLCNKLLQCSNIDDSHPNCYVDLK